MAIINAKARAEAITAPPKPARSFPPASPVYIAGVVFVVVAVVEFPPADVVLIPVFDGAAAVVDIDGHIVVVVVMETIVKLELGANALVEINDVGEAVADVEDATGKVEAAVEETELEDESTPAQKPPTQVLKAHCEFEVHWAWKLPQLGTCIAFTA